jgi:tRNA-specific 2-thiouridylase
LYVTELDPVKNAVIVGSKEDLLNDQFIVSHLNWIAIGDLNQALEMSVKIRSAHKETVALVAPLDDGLVQVTLKEPQSAVTPGQTAVFYRNESVVGAGIIEHIVSKTKTC